MKTRHIIGAVLLIIGMFLAIATADGSKNEVILRAAGVALIAAGATATARSKPRRARAGQGCEERGDDSPEDRMQPYKIKTKRNGKEETL